MISKWTSHLKDPEEKQRFESSILGSKRVLERQKEIIDEMISELNIAETSPKNYEIPNWDYRQAHNNGFRQCLNVMRKLITIEEDQP
jgi:hypothetical protein